MSSNSYAHGSGESIPSVLLGGEEREQHAGAFTHRITDS